MNPSTTMRKRAVVVLSTAALGASLALAVPAVAATAPADDTAAGPAAKAVAAAASVRRDLCFTGACGSATVTFKSRTTAYVRMSLKDTACDAKGPTLQMQGLQYSGTNMTGYVSHGTKHKNTLGCHRSYQSWQGYYGHPDGDALNGLRVHICNGSRCETSTWMLSPYRR
jgi:hypothetical protein